MSGKERPSRPPKWRHKWTREFEDHAPQRQSNSFGIARCRFCGDPILPNEQPAPAGPVGQSTLAERRKRQ